MQEYTPVKEGKVREIYDIGEQLIMVATDRISAFDVILKNKIVKKGNMDRKSVDVENTVEVHYKGSTRTGQVFDASRFADMPKARQEMMKQYRPEDYDKDEPVKFQLNRVIKGWGEGLQLIGEGGKIILWIPAELAYGSRGAGQDIGPNEALRFDVELISVELPEVVEEAPVEAADSVVVAE